jgi:hypothetical protein
MGAESLDEIKAIVKRQSETGEYCGTRFLLARELHEAVRAVAPPPTRTVPPLGESSMLISGLLAIPVLVDESLPPGAWRLIDSRTDEILFSGQVELTAPPELES